MVRKRRKLCNVEVIKALNKYKIKENSQLVSNLLESNKPIKNMLQKLKRI